MSKTVPQLKKIDRNDPEKVEQISQPYAWQKAQAAEAKATKPAAPRPATASEQHIRTIPVGKPGSRRR